mgnify:FL=1|jgi:hypothetical protein
MSKHTQSYSHNEGAERYSHRHSPIDFQPYFYEYE